MVVKTINCIAILITQRVKFIKKTNKFKINFILSAETEIVHLNDVVGSTENVRHFCFAIGLFSLYLTKCTENEFDKALLLRHAQTGGKKINIQRSQQLKKIERDKVRLQGTVLPFL